MQQVINKTKITKKELLKNCYCLEDVNPYVRDIIKINIEQTMSIENILKGDRKMIYNISCNDQKVSIISRNTRCVLNIFAFIYRVCRLYSFI